MAEIKPDSISWQCLVLYGDYKTGKSLAAAKLAAHMPIIYFDLEKNAKSMLIQRLSPEELKNISYFSTEDNPDTRHAIKAMRTFWQGDKVQFCAEHGLFACQDCISDKRPFQSFSIKDIPPEACVVIDSGTQLSESAEFEAGKNVDWESPISGDGPSFGVWRTVGFYLSQILAGIRNRKFHVILITHAQSLQRGNDQVQISPILGSQKFAVASPRNATEVCYLWQENRKYKITNFGSNQVYAGTQSAIPIADYSTEEYHDLYPFFNPSYAQENKPQKESKTSNPKTSTSSSKFKL